MGHMKRERKALFCLIAAVIIAIGGGSSFGGFVVTAQVMSVSGEIKTNVTWLGDVYVTGDVYVPKGVTLTIAAGATIRFADRKDDQISKLTVVEDRPLKGFTEARAELLVAGTLIARGTRNNMITFTGDWSSNDPNLPLGQWGGIVIFGKAEKATLEYLVITYAEIGITIDNDSTIENSYIMGSWGSLCDRPPIPDPGNPNRAKNHADVRVGISLRGSGGSTVRKNILLENTWGIHANTGGTGKVPITIEGNWIALNMIQRAGFDVPNGIHVYQTVAVIENNWIAHNKWGIEVSKSIVKVKNNEFSFNHFGFVWYFEDDEAICKPSVLCGNSARSVIMNYVKKTNGSLALPEWWFCP